VYYAQEHLILNQNGCCTLLDGQGAWHVWGTQGVHTELWSGNLRESDNL